VAFAFHRIPIGICNCYLLRGKRTILVDAGAQGGFSSFIKEMKKLAIDPKEIDLILLTHGHWDHITCLKQVQDASGARIAIHHKDQYMVETGAPPFPDGTTAYGRFMSWSAKTLLNTNLPRLKVDLALDDNGMSLSDYGIPGRVVYTPGHSAGHISILLDSGDAIVGDMAMNAWYLRLTPGLPILADDLHTVVESWRRILPMGVKRVYPAHGRDFPVDVMHREIGNFK
jgi:hydroxyacylglutathione hydrolase